MQSFKTGRFYIKNLDFWLFFKYTKVRWSGQGFCIGNDRLALKAVILWKRACSRLIAYVQSTSSQQTLVKIIYHIVLLNRAEQKQKSWKCRFLIYLTIQGGKSPVKDRAKWGEPNDFIKVMLPGTIAIQGQRWKHFTTTFQ